MLRERRELLPEVFSGPKPVQLLSQEAIDNLAQTALVPESETSLVFVPANVLDCDSGPLRLAQIKWWLLCNLPGSTEDILKLGKRNILEEIGISQDKLGDFSQNRNGQIDTTLLEPSRGLETLLPEWILLTDWPGAIEPRRAKIPLWFENLHRLNENFQQKAIMIAMGWNNKHMAQAFQVEYGTLKQQASEIYSTLGVGGRYSLFELSWVPTEYLCHGVECPLTRREREVVAETWMMRRMKAANKNMNWNVGEVEKVHLYHSMGKMRSLIANARDLSNAQLLMIAVANGWGTSN